jgi:hypothetical protein
MVKLILSSTSTSISGSKPGLDREDNRVEGCSWSRGVMRRKNAVVGVGERAWNDQHKGNDALVEIANP